jgi:hypothetical protein
MGIHPIRRIAVAVGAALAIAACLRAPQQSPGLAAVKDATITSNQLQLRAFELGRRYSAIIEIVADSVQARSADPVVQRNALLWKASGIPLAQEAALHNDPVVAAADLWAFAAQQLEYFEHGAGREAFGELQPGVLRACRRMLDDARRLASRISPTGQLPPEAEAGLKRWVLAHPLRGPELARETIVASDWKLIGLSDASLTGQIASMEQSLGLITGRLGLLNEGIFKQVRWNAELMVQDALTAGRVDSLMGALTTTIDQVGGLAAGTPELMDAQRTALMDGVRAERIALLTAVAGERRAVFDAIAAERTALLRGIDDERKGTFEQLRGERIATLLAVDSITQRSIDHTGAVITRLVWQLALAFGLLLALAAAATAMLLVLSGRLRKA